MCMVKMHQYSTFNLIQMRRKILYMSLYSDCFTLTDPCCGNPLHQQETHSATSFYAPECQHDSSNWTAKCYLVEETKLSNSRPIAAIFMITFLSVEFEFINLHNYNLVILFVCYVSEVKTCIRELVG